jgi:hypothetical protein
MTVVKTSIFMRVQMTQITWCWSNAGSRTKNRWWEMAQPGTEALLPLLDREMKTFYPEESGA